MKLLKTLFILELAQSALAGHATGTSENTDGILADEDRKQLNDLPFEEQKVALNKLFDKIDSDENSQLDKKEIVAWSRSLEQKYMDKEITEWFPFYDLDLDGVITHEEFLKMLKSLEDFHGDNFLLMKQKFAATDFNGDGKLDLAEFEAFQFPRFNKKVKFLWKKEMFLHFDGDSDGKVTYQEFLTYQGLDESTMSMQEIENERTQFNERDEDKDNVLTLLEIDFLLEPDDEDVFEVTADHLIHLADENRDGTVSREELLQNYDIVLNSQVSDHGQMFHDEL